MTRKTSRVSIACLWLAAVGLLTIVTPPALAGGGDGTGDCAADVNGDTYVDVHDLIEVILSWGPCPDGGKCPADIVPDGVVDVHDLLAVIMSFGPCNPEDACESSEACDDGNDCTFDVCFFGICYHIPIHGCGG